MVRQGSAKPSSTSSNLVVTSKRFPEASASGIFCFYRVLFLRRTPQRTFAVLQGALPRGGAVALRSAAIQQQRLAGAERHGGGLCAAEGRPPLPPVYAYRDSRTQLEKAIVAYIDYYYNRRIKLKLNGLSPVQYRIQTVGAA